MEGLLKQLLDAILGGGASGVVGLALFLPAIMTWFVWKREREFRSERAELIANFQAAIDGDRKELLNVINEYQKGQLNTIEAITEIRVLIATQGTRHNP